MAQEPEPISNEEGALLNRIRVETAFSRFPIHQLSKTGTISIDLRGQDTSTEDLDFRWMVSSNKEYGHPGPLALKIDKLIIDRRIDEAPRPLPEVLRLGSLREICRELRISDHDTDPVKKALHQNASVYITAKIQCQMRTRKVWKEVGFSRYSVIFTGQTLPDGTQADAVYIVLNAHYRTLLSEISVRPLDYDYLFDLNPAAQRLYELLSFPMYGALSNDRPRARLRYSSFCMFAPVTRYFDYDPVKKQMSKIHKPHRESGYITKAQFQETVDAHGNKDWEMLYTPGPKALAEHKAFARKNIAAPPLAALPAPVKPEPASDPEQGQIKFDLMGEDNTLRDELMRRGVAEKKAITLLANLKPGQEVMDQIEYTDFILAQAPSGKFRNPPGLYIHNVEQNLIPPSGFESSRRRKLHAAAAQARNHETGLRARLEMKYEEYQHAEVERYIAERISPQEYAELLQEKIRQCRAVFQRMNPSQLEDVARGYIKSEVKDSGSVPLVSFDTFCQQHNEKRALQN